MENVQAKIPATFAASSLAGAILALSLPESDLLNASLYVFAATIPFCVANWMLVIDTTGVGKTERNKDLIAASLFVSSCATVAGWGLVFANRSISILLSSEINSGRNLVRTSIKHE